MKELVEWNNEHADEALTAGKSIELWPRMLTNVEHPSQDLLVAAVETKYDEDRRRDIKAVVDASGAAFMDLFTRYNADVILCPADTTIPFLSAAAGMTPGAI
jgi:hypothetical protein